MNRILSMLAATLLLAAPLVPHAAAHGTVYADLAERVSPAVVSISTTQSAGPSRQFDLSDIPDDHPMKRFLERFGGPDGRFGGRGGDDVQRSSGSGFIFDPTGFIITNHHVIDGAETITVTLSDEREFTASVIGSDEATDVALLKIDAGTPLPFAVFGDSSIARVGEEVLAVGNAFGLSGSVSRGIVSAKGRDIRIGGPYVDFIQTDAAINRGNSGGPLFSMSGQVIGMNTAIFSPTGGSVGIGFAVPSNIVARIINDLRDDGTVSRGWIGVSIQPVTDAIAEALGLAETRGAIVAGVLPTGPSVGTLREGDVILSFNGQSLTKDRDLPRFVANTQAGSSVPVVVLRDRTQQTIYLTVGSLPRQAALTVPTTPSVQEPMISGRIGAKLAAVTSRLQQRYGLSTGESGALVVGVDSRGPARDSGILEGDLIVQIDDWSIRGPEDVRNAIANVAADSVLLRLKREGRLLFIGLALA